jgi:hypothetical protein
MLIACDKVGEGDKSLGEGGIGLQIAHINQRKAFIEQHLRREEFEFQAYLFIISVV